MTEDAVGLLFGVGGLVAMLIAILAFVVRGTRRAVADHAVVSRLDPRANLTMLAARATGITAFLVGLWNFIASILRGLLHTVGGVGLEQSSTADALWAGFWLCLVGFGVIHLGAQAIFVGIRESPARVIRGLAVVCGGILIGPVGATSCFVVDQLTSSSRVAIRGELETVTVTLGVNLLSLLAAGWILATQRQTLRALQTIRDAGAVPPS